MFSSLINKQDRKWIGAFTFFNLILMQVVACLYVVLSGVYPTTGYAWLFLVSYWFGQLFLIAGLSLFITIPLYLIAQRGVSARRALGVIAAALLVFMIFDTFVFAQYRFHINMIVLDLFFNSHGQVIEFTADIWFATLGVLGLFIAIEIVVGNLFFKRIAVLPPLRPAFLLYGFLFLGSQLGHAWADAQYYTPVTRLANLLPLSAPLQTKSLFMKYGLIDAEEVKKRKQLRQDFENSDLKYPLEPLQCHDGQIRPSVAKPMNVLFLVVDSLRADMLNDKIMPHVFEFAKSATTFEQHFSNSNSTRHGIFSLMYGIPGSYFEAALRNQVAPVLVSEAAKRDYVFGIFANAPLTKPEFDQTVFLPVKNLRKISKSETVDGRDIEITDEMIAFLEKQTTEKSFFGFMFYDGPHGYAYPKTMKVPYPDAAGFSYMNLNANSDPTLMREVYSNSVYFDDSQIKRVLDTLKAKGFLENTVIVFTGDHGQEFNDNKKGYWGHNSNYSLYQTHVPMVVYWPGRTPGVIAERTTHFDVSSTLMSDLFGCSNSKSFSSGQNLYDREGRDWFIMGREGDYAIRAGELTTVVYPKGDYDIVDDTYTPIAGAKLNGDIMGEALKEMRRFKK